MPTYKGVNSYKTRHGGIQNYTPIKPYQCVSITNNKTTTMVEWFVVLARGHRKEFIPEFVVEVFIMSYVLLTTHRRGERLGLRVRSDSRS